MKKGILAALIALSMISLSVSIDSVHATTTCPVQSVPGVNVTQIQGFQSPIVAGSTYTARFRLNNTADESLTVFVNMNVSNKKYPLNFGEFFVSMWINSKPLNCSEKMPGSFYCYNKTSEYALAKKSSNELYINFSSLPNLYPDNNYTFTLGILTEHPPISVLFADGSGQFSSKGKRITGQAKIYMDSGKSSVRLWIKDSRTREEFSRDYEVMSHYRAWYGEVYNCANSLGQTFRIDVYFNTLVYGSGTDVYFFGRRA
jgi:hypothetical protein